MLINPFFIEPLTNSSCSLSQVLGLELIEFTHTMQMREIGKKIDIYMFRKKLITKDLRVEKEGN